MDEHLAGRTPVFECEFRMRHQDGQMLWMLARGIAVADRNGRRYRMVGSQADITERKQVELRLQRAAFRDPLTGLDNRAQMKIGLEQALASSIRRPTGVGVLFLDLDNFKAVNDTLGHSAGDHVLCVIARRLTVEVREYDRIARFGGDEFMILIDDLEDVEQAQRIAHRVLKTICTPINLEDNEAILSASIGIATCMTGHTDPEYLLQSADVAMYQAKASGKNGVAVFDPNMMSSLVERMELEHLLRAALDNHLVKLQYQPIIELATSHVTAIEALARLQDYDGNLIPPSAFIPVAEAAGLMIPLGEAVLERAGQ
jgi:diguanylate cyclase (GGDEF)-like protein